LPGSENTVSDAIKQDKTHVAETRYEKWFDLDPYMEAREKAYVSHHGSREQIRMVIYC
jgi:hypothetical protein